MRKKTIGPAAAAGLFAVFLAGLLAIIAALGAVFQPQWETWNNYDTFHGFYEEPEDTVETLFLGSSYTVNGITPMELYREYGICAYNLGSEQQPVMSSYYWLLEAYRLHGGSLGTVVMQCGSLFKNPNRGMFHKSIDGMRNIPLRARAAWEYAKSRGEGLGEAICYFSPFFAYHDRWSELEGDELGKRGRRPARYTRGYHFAYSFALDEEGYEDVATPSYGIPPGTKPAKPKGDALRYLEKMAEFCREKGLRLVLVTQPGKNIKPGKRVMLSNFAEENGIEYLDVSGYPLLGETGIDLAADLIDEKHENYYGAIKMTRFIGRYLRDECGARDVRGDGRYDFLEGQLREYDENVSEVAALCEERELASYIRRAMGREDCAVLLSAKGECGAGLGEEAREELSGIGLKKLSALGLGEPYVAVIEGGKVILESSGGGDAADGENAGGDSIAEKGRLSGGRKYRLRSGGEAAECVIGGEDFSLNENGINIVVYDCAADRLIDAASFDTSSSDRREAGYPLDLLEEELAKKPAGELSPRLKGLALYEERCDQARREWEAEWGKTGDGKEVVGR